MYQNPMTPAAARRRPTPALSPSAPGTAAGTSRRVARLWLQEGSDAVRREDKNSRPPDTEALIFSEAGSGNYQPGSVARGHKNQVRPVSAHIPGAIAYLKTATHCETHPRGDR